MSHIDKSGSRDKAADITISVHFDIVVNMPFNVWYIWVTSGLVYWQRLTILSIELWYGYAFLVVAVTATKATIQYKDDILPV